MTHFIRNAIIIGATPMTWGALAVGYKILSWCSTNDLKADWIKISLFFFTFFYFVSQKRRRHECKLQTPWHEIHTSTRDPHEIQVIPQRPAELFVVLSSEHRPSTVTSAVLGSPPCPPCRSAAEAILGPCWQKLIAKTEITSERLLQSPSCFHCGILRSLWSLWKRRVWTKLSHWKSFRIIETETIVSFHLALAFPHQWAQRR